MSRASSSRERALWLWTGVVVLAIYSTLGVARIAVETLRERNLLRVGVTVLLVAIAIVGAVGLARRRPGRFEVAAALGITVLYAVVLIPMERVEERLHIVEYGLVGGLVYLALEERRRNGMRPRGPVWPLAIGVTAALGWIDEIIQGILPSRYYDLRDVGLNALAGVLAVTAIALLGRARRKDS